MDRTYDLATTVTLPRIDAAGGDALTTELLSSAKSHKKLPARVESARKKLAQSQKSLQAALTARVQPQAVADTARAREADTAEDATFAAMFDWLTGFTKLPIESDVTAAAEKLRGALFADGLKFTQLPFKLEWSEADTRLRAIDENAELSSAFKTLGGEIFLKTLRKVHKEYGEALGITAAKPPPTTSTAVVKEPLDGLRDALRRYALMVMAHGEGDEEEREVDADVLLAPLKAWQPRASRAKASAIIEPPTPTAPIQPSGQTPTTPTAPAAAGGQTSAS